MDVQETLTQIDHIMTEVDLVLYEWREATDMMSFIGQDVPLKLWTNDNPPVVMEISDFPNLLACQDQDVRVMHFRDGEWSKVGTARVNRLAGRLIASIHDEEVIKKLQGEAIHGIHAELGGPLAHFKVDEAGSWEQMLPLNPPFEGFNKAITKAVPNFDPPFSREIYTDEDWDIRNNVPLKDSPTWWEGVENHPFFDNLEEFKKEMTDPKRRITGRKTRNEEN